MGKRDSIDNSHRVEPALAKPKDTKFVVYEDGTHAHRIYDGRRQDGLLELLKDKLEVLRETSKVARDHHNNTESQPKDVLGETIPVVQLEPPSPPSSPTRPLLKVPPISSSTLLHIQATYQGPVSREAAASLIDRYGKNREQIGSGASGVVTVTFRPHSADHPTGGQLFAVKKFSQRPKDSTKKHMKRVGAEFCISSSLHHPNIIQTLDLIQDTDGNFCQIMEYCSGGDVFSRIKTQGKLCAAEANCYFKQLIRGLSYLHKIGVVHRDIKPDNLLLTSKGCLKIADFGNAECVRLPWQETVRLTSGLCGSFPYISPEQYVILEYRDDGSRSQYYFDARAADVWSAAIVYMDMCTGRHVWRFSVVDQDEDFEDYARSIKKSAVWEPIEKLEDKSSRRTIYSMLYLDWNKRPSMNSLLKSEWIQSIHVCKAGEGLEPL